MAHGHHPHRRRPRLYDQPVRADSRLRFTLDDDSAFLASKTDLKKGVASLCCACCACCADVRSISACRLRHRKVSYSQRFAILGICGPQGCGSFRDCETTEPYLSSMLPVILALNPCTSNYVSKSFEPYTAVSSFRICKQRPVGKLAAILRRCLRVVLRADTFVDL